MSATKTQENVFTATLDESSQRALHKLIANRMPSKTHDWTVSAHHVTLCVGPKVPEGSDILARLEALVGQRVNFTVTELGCDDVVCAAKVQVMHPVLRGIVGELSTMQKLPRFSHVTLAVNPKGGKPVLSNFIKEWTPYKGGNLWALVERKLPNLSEHGTKLNTGA